MMRYMFIFVFLCSCVSVQKSSFIVRGELIELEKLQKKPFSNILVQWKNYPYSEYHKIDNLEKEDKTIRYQDVEAKDYARFKNNILRKFKELGLYDVENGTGSLKIILVSYGRWTYKELFKTYLTDTAYIFILPSSLPITYKMIAILEQGENQKRFENIGYVKTVFFLPLFPLYPLMTYNGAEKTLINNLLYKTIKDIVDYQYSKNLAN